MLLQGPIGTLALNTKVSLGTRIFITRQAAGRQQAGRQIRIRSREAFSRTFPCRKNAAVYCQAVRLAGGKSTVSCSNIFDLLGLPRSSTVEEMRHAYRLRAKELHPDQNKQDGAAEEFQHLQKLFKEWKAIQDSFADQGQSAQSREFMHKCQQTMMESFNEAYDSEFW